MSRESDQLDRIFGGTILAILWAVFLIWLVTQ